MIPQMVVTRAGHQLCRKLSFCSLWLVLSLISGTLGLLFSSYVKELEAYAFASEEEEEELPASQAAAREEEKLEAVRCYIRSNPTLYDRILFYEPIELADLHAELKLNGIKISKAKLLDFLDAQCITFTTAGARKEKEQKRKGSKKKRKRY